MQSSAQLRISMLQRALRHRASATVALFVASVISFVAALSGPIYLSAAQSVALHSIISSSSEASQTLSLTPIVTGQPPAPKTVTQAARLLTNDPVLHSWFPHFTFTYDLGGTLLAPGYTPFRDDIVARTQQCEHLVFAAGHCPDGPGYVALSVRTSKLFHFHLGSKVHYHIGSSRVTLTIQGLYNVPSASARYWSNNAYFPFGSTQPNAQIADDSFVDLNYATNALEARFTDLVQASAISFLQLDRIHVSKVTAFQHELTRSSSFLVTHDHYEVSTEMTQVLAHGLSINATMGFIVEIISIEVIALALLSIYFLMSRTVDDRRGDVALAQLRGYSHWGQLRLLMLEPLAVIAAALPTGVAVSALLTFLALSLTHTHVSIPIDTASVASLLAVLIGATLAVTLGSLRTISGGALAPSGGEQQRRRSALRVLIADVVVVALALGGTVELLSGTGHVANSGYLALATPFLLTLALAVMALRLVPLLLRGVIAMTKERSRVTLFLVTRSLYRRSRSARFIALLALSSALLVFAESAWLSSKNNRVELAALSVGAAHVISVDVPQQTTLVSVVDRLDPSGHHLMGAIIEQSNQGNTLAVQGSRMLSVMNWQSSPSIPSLKAIKADIDPSEPPAAVFNGGYLQATVYVDPHHAPLSPTALELLYRQEGDQQFNQADFPRLRPGLHTYVTAVGGLCRPGCSVSELAVNDLGSSASTPSSSTSQASIPSENVRLQFAGLKIGHSAAGPWRTLPLSAHSATRWLSSAPSGEAGSINGVGTFGVRMSFPGVQPGLEIGVEPRDIPTPIPAIVASGNGSSSQSTINAAQGALTGLDGNVFNTQTKAVVPTLAQVGTSGGLVDLRFAQLIEVQPQLGTIDQIWDNQTKIGDLLKELHKLGVSVTNVQSQSAVLANLEVQGPFLASDYFVVAAALAVVIALMSTAFILASSSAQRSAEISFLSTLSISKKRAARVIYLENAIILILGMTVGALGGIIGIKLALSSIPQFSSPPPGLTLNYALSSTLIGTTVLIELLLLALVGRIGVSLIKRRALGTLLRSSD